MSSTKILWDAPSQEDKSSNFSLKNFTQNFKENELQADTFDLNPTLELLFKIGTPSVQGATTPKDEAIGLLKLAAEVEHALMIQYLYATASLLPNDMPSFSPSRKIAAIAVQEMGHLISVQNLLLAIGGPSAFHFGRDKIRESSPQNPIPLLLEPLSELALARYIGAEMPAVIDDPVVREKVEKLLELLSDDTPNRVGAIYAKLFWLFQPSDEPVAPLFLSPNERIGLKPGWHLVKDDFTYDSVIKNFQAVRDNWLQGSIIDFILKDVFDSASALSLITEISEQGEGLGDKHNSHFFEFFELWEMFVDGKLKISSLPKINLPRIDVPVLNDELSAYIQMYGDLMDIRYSILIMDLWHGISTPNSSALRVKIIQLAYQNMFFLRGLSAHIMSLRSDFGVEEASPSFNLLFEDYPESIDLVLIRYGELIGKQKIVIGKIKENAMFQNCSVLPCEILDATGDALLGNLAQNDEGRKIILA